MKEYNPLHLHIFWLILTLIIIYLVINNIIYNLTILSLDRIAIYKALTLIAFLIIYYGSRILFQLKKLVKN